MYLCQQMAALTLSNTVISFIWHCYVKTVYKSAFCFVFPKQIMAKLEISSILGFPERSGRGAFGKKFKREVSFQYLCLFAKAE